MKIAPEYGQATVHVLDASRVVDVVSSLLSDERTRRRSSRRTAALQDDAARAAQRAPRAAAAAVRGRAGEPAQDRLGARAAARAGVHRPPRARRMCRSRSGAVHRLDVLLRGVGAEGPVPGDPRPPAVRRGGARPVRQRAGAARSHRAREAADGAAASTASGRRPAKATTSSSTAIGDADRRADALQHAAAAGSDRRRQAEPVAGRLRRGRAAAGARRLPRRVRRHRRARRRRAGARFEREHDDYNAILVKALADRLAEAFAAYLHARARQEWGIDEAVERRRRSLPKRIAASGPAFGYPALSRSQREVQAVRSARRRRGRHRR